MKQSLYVCIFAAFIFYLPTFACERYKESIFTGLMTAPQLKIITLTQSNQDHGYILDRSKVNHVANTSFIEDKKTKVESYLAVFHGEGMVTYSYFHEGPDKDKLLVFLEEPGKQPLKGQAADFNYLKKRFLESNITQK